MINILYIHFKNEIGFNEIPLLRGALIKSFETDENLLLHNHIGEDFRYKYPLVQYKRKDGKALVVCIGNGIGLLGQYFLQNNLTLSLKTRDIRLEVESLVPVNNNVELYPNKREEYLLNNWLPFNQDNYQKYNRIEGLVDKYKFLENILIGNILSFSKDMGVFFEGKVECQITNIDSPCQTIYKKTKMLSFNVQFTVNVNLPDYIGIGKGVSLGYGILQRNK